MKRLQSCCCCTTRTGAIVLAILGIISYCIELIPLIYYTIIQQALKQGWYVADQQLKHYLEEGRISQEQYEASAQIYHVMDSSLVAILAVSYILIILMIAVDALLLHGVLNNKHRLMLPHLVVYIIFLTIGVLGGIGVGIWMMIAVNWILGIVLVAIEIIFGGLGLYFWFVVLSAYLDIRDMNEHQRVRADEEMKKF